MVSWSPFGLNLLKWLNFLGFLNEKYETQLVECMLEVSHSSVVDFVVAADATHQLITSADAYSSLLLHLIEYSSLSFFPYLSNSSTLFQKRSIECNSD